MEISSSGQGTEYIPRYGCTYNPSATGASATMTCTPNTYDGAFTMPDQDIKVTSIDVAMNSLTDYNLTLTLKNENTVRGTLSGTLGMSGNGQGSLTLTSNGSSTTTTINKNSLTFVLPKMKANSINNSLDSDAFKLFYTPAITSLKDKFTMILLREVSADDVINGKVSMTNGTEYTLRYSNYVLQRFGSYVLEAFTCDNTEAKILYFKFPSTYNNKVVIPLYVGGYNSIPDDLYRYVYGKDRTIEAIDAQTAADQQHHDEMMDTSDSSKIQTDGNALVNDADEKFGDLFFPLNHAIETANDLANVNATGVIRLPAIFSNGDYWYLDLTQIEQKLPTAWTFIRSLCQLAVAIYMIHGLYSLFFGGKEDDS